MPKNISFGSKTYNLPLTSEEEYWDDLVNFLADVPSGVFQKDSGLFELTQEIDFGSLHGVKAKYWKSRSGNEANSGTIRLNKDDFIAFRNEANNADVSLAKDSDDFLTFNNTRLLVDPTTSEGDLITRNASGVLTKLPKGTTGQVLTATSSGQQYQDLPVSDVEPLGKIIPVDSRFATLPATGEITPEGYALCNGQPLSGLTGHQLSTSETNLPDLTDGRYLKGSTSSGTRAGTNTTTLSVTNLPVHSHGPGNFQTSIGLSVSKPFLTGTTTFAAAGHTHGDGSYFAAMNSELNGTQLTLRTLDAAGVSYNSSYRETIIGSGYGSGGDTGIQTFGIQVLGTSGGNSSNATVNLNQGTYTLTGSNAVIGTTAPNGSSQPFTNEPAHESVVYLMKVKKV